MKFASASLATAVLLVALPALAEPSTLYLRLDGGGGAGGRAAESGVANIGLGTSLPIPFLPMRSELDLSYRPDYGPGSNFTAIENLLIDIPLSSAVKPFVGIGAGVAVNRLTGQTSTNFAWNAVSGLGFNFAPGFGFDLTYRYLEAGNFKTAGLRSPIKGSEVMAGIRIGL